MVRAEPAPIVACTVSRDVQHFDLLIEDMEAVLGDAWGDLGFSEAVSFFGQRDASGLEFVALAVDGHDERDMASLLGVVHAAQAHGIKVILVAEDLSPLALHQLLRAGAREFVPYPLPEGELAAAVERLRAPEPEAQLPATAAATAPRATNNRDGVVLPVHGLAGGTGATTVAVNLAWELCIAEKQAPPRVCLLDLDLQFGTASTYLDLPRREAVFELWSDTEAVDGEGLMAALVAFNEKLHVLTAPADILPLDLITPQDVERVIELARRNFDYVIIDMPSTVVMWTETVLTAAHVYFATIELDMRSAQNALRFKRALQSEDLPFEKLRFLLNRGPKFTDLSGKSRVKRMAESLGISIEIQLADGGKQVVQAGDHGLPLSETVPKNPLAKDLRKLALHLHEHNRKAAEGG